MAEVWKRSQHSGSALLMLLAIGDFADDEGRAYPAVATLARKVRVKPRAANYTLRELQDSGELDVRIGEGPKGTNLYRIALKRLGVQKIAGLQSAAGVQGVAALQGIARGAAISCSSPLQPAADKPSKNHQETPDTPPRSAKLPHCPHQALIGLYHDALPDLPRVRLMDDAKRIKALREFWTWVLKSTKSNGSRRAETTDQAMEWIKSYFERALGNDFLMGRTSRDDRHRNWKCDLDYLLTEKGKRQVIEKTEETTA